MTDMAWEDSRARHLLHQIINCVHALGGYAELGEFQKAITLTFECASELSSLRVELEKMRDGKVRGEGTTMLHDLIERLNEAERIHRRHGHDLDEYGRMLVIQSAGGVCFHCGSHWGHFRDCYLIGGESQSVDLITSRQYQSLAARVAVENSLWSVSRNRLVTR